MSASVTEQRSTTRNESTGQPSDELRAYKRSPELSNSRWYKGFLYSVLAGSSDTNEALNLAIAKMRPGAEPPPHIHTREDEFLYILAGELRAYADRNVFSLTAGESIFLPRRKPHAWLITSDEAKVILVVTPGGFLDALYKLSAQAEQTDLPTSADTVTYATADLTETLKVFQQYGIRLLTRDEIRAEMPQYPL
jgi:quercetin dioxygenase-like cupin family protein